MTNNPLRYTDPTGHMLCAVCEGEGGGGYTPPNSPNLPDLPDPNPDSEPDDDDGGPQCDPNVPGCNPIFSDQLNEEELLNLEIDLLNWQSNLNHITIGSGVVGVGLLAGGGIAGLSGIGAPLAPALVLAGSLATLVSIGTAYESAQLGYLIQEVITMQDLATSSPSQNVNVYVYTDEDHYAPLPSLSYEGADGVYTSNSFTTITVLLSFP